MSIFLQKLIIETPWLAHMRPKGDDSRWSRVSFDINCSPHQAPSVKSVGITGQLTGSRVDLMILDDIEVPGNSMTELMRENYYNSALKQNLSQLLKMIPVFFFLGTPRPHSPYIVNSPSVTIVRSYGRPVTRKIKQITKVCSPRRCKKTVTTERFREIPRTRIVSTTWIF